MAMVRHPPSSIVAALFRAHARRVQNFLGFRLSDAAEGEDAAQEVFLKLWRKEREGALREEATNYMYTATHSAMVDAARHRAYASQDRVPDFDIDTVPEVQPAPEEVLHWRKAMGRLVEAVKSLPEATKKVFVLYHFKGMNYDEIAAELRVSRRTVERHVAAGLAGCRERMKDYL